MKRFVFLLSLITQMCWGWGEVGHHLVARSAVKILKTHPLISKTDMASDRLESFLSVFNSKEYQQGHVANIPDTYWRNLESPLTEAGNLLGSPTHYLNSESLLVQLKLKNLIGVELLLDYAKTQRELKELSHFFTDVGSLPWRAQQFTDLYTQALNSQLGSTECKSSKKSELNTRVITTHAGLLTHFTGDVTMPYHTTIDHDAIAVGQKGIHSYFEQDLVNELEIENLFSKVVERAKSLMNPLNEEPNSLSAIQTQALQRYPKQTASQRTTALMLTVAMDSFSNIEKLRQLDYTYAIASFKEALIMPQCQNLAVVKELKNQYDKLETQEQRTAFENVKVLSYPSTYDDKKVEPACRRLPSTRVDIDGKFFSEGKSVAQWHEALIIDRLALATILTADIWVHEWQRANQPKLCPTYLYSHKPSFISPAEKNCSGYAAHELGKEFVLSHQKTAQKQNFSHGTQSYCLSF